MSWRDWTAALTRRWYVVLAGLMVTAALIGVSPILAPPEYSARGLVVLLPPREATREGGNPFLGLGGLDLPARILVAYYSSNSAQDAIVAVSPDAEVTVGIEESTRSPVIAIDVIDSSPEAALKTLNFVAETIPTNLARLQAEVSAPTDTRVTSMTLTMDERAEPDLSKLIRMLVAAGVGGLALTALLTFAVDGAARRRRAELEASTSGPPTGEPEVAEDAPPRADTEGEEAAPRRADAQPDQQLLLDSPAPLRRPRQRRRRRMETDQHSNPDGVVRPDDQADQSGSVELSAAELDELPLRA
jgi:hypothetical protein